jgi:hypothetical protein
MTKKLLFVFAALLCHANSFAQSLILHGPSYHSLNVVNNSNYGVSFKFPQGFAVGVFRNSEGNISQQVTYEFIYSDNLSLLVGGATGYNNVAISPVVIPVFKLPFERLSVLAGVAPYYDRDLKRVGILAHLMLEFKIK